MTKQALDASLIGRNSSANKVMFLFVKNEIIGELNERETDLF